MSIEENKVIVDDSDNTNSAVDYTEEKQSEHLRHHEHHHGHRHHHHHKKHKSVNDSSIGRFFKRHKSELKGMAVMFVTMLAIIVVLQIAENNLEPKVDYNSASSSDKTSRGETMQDDSLIYVGVPLLDDEMTLVDRAVINYVNADSDTPINAIVTVTEEKRFDIGYPIKLGFDVNTIPEEYSLEKATLEISETADYKNTRFIEIDDDYSGSIYGLKTGTEYYYRFSVYLSGGKELDYCGTFKTAESPRILSIDGIRNVRDIGGWKTEDGKAIKQGLLYRGTELDGAVEQIYKITGKGIDEMLSVIGVKTDMDLRAPEDSVPGTYILGANVEHTYYKMVMYAAIETDEGKEAVRAVFSDLAKPYKYPIYLHCTYGLDRTGTVCYLLEALLGMGKNDLIKEYELSGLTHSNVLRDNILLVEDILETYEGETLSQKTENYLISTGITPEEIASIKEIFLS